MLSNLPEYVVEEKINFDPKVMAMISRDGTAPTQTIGSERGNVKIIRNLIDDTFNVEYWRPHNDQSHLLYPYLNMSLNGTTQKTFDLRDLSDGKTEHGNFIGIHRSLYQDAKFHDISTLTTGYTFGRGNLESPEPRFTLLRTTTTPGFPNIQKRIETSFGRVIHLRTIKSIEYSKRTPFSFSGTTGSEERPTEDDKEINVQLTYNNIYLVPRELDRYNANKTLFDIYMNNEDGTSIENDKNIISGSMTSSSFGKDKVDTEFFSETSDQKVFHNISSEKVGRIDITNNSYYDYETGKSHLGNQGTSEDGEIIPYSLKGNYTRNLDISFNESFKGMKISLSKIFTNALLDANEGDVRMFLDETERFHFQDVMEFSRDDMKSIKENDHSLISLRRMNEANQ